MNLCLKSLMKATEETDSEIIVIDNHSSDDSVKMIRENFPRVRLIENSTNTGFGRACNQGIDSAEGEFILILNPDTIVGESLLKQAVDELRNRPEAGALGIRLIDGKGETLRESKRSIPTFWSAFTKFSGLGRIFSRSAYFNQYYAPGLSYEEIGEIEVLPGAFMLIRKKVLDEIGGFDPRFFMYAEDIDLSYRILKAGYKIIYAGHLQTIHFKGESTEKSLMNYTETFFTSMQLFVQKYTGELYSPFVSWTLQLIIRLIQWGQKKWRKWVMQEKKDRPLDLPHRTLLLSEDPYINEVLERQFGFRIERVSDSDEIPAPDATASLRYLPSLVRTDLDFSLIFDVDALSFDHIVSVWAHQRGRIFYLMDRHRSYMITSVDKEKRGDVYVFCVDEQPGAVFQGSVKSLSPGSAE